LCSITTPDPSTSSTVAQSNFAAFASMQMNLPFVVSTHDPIATDYLRTYRITEALLWEEDLTRTPGDRAASFTNYTEQYFKDRAAFMTAAADQNFKNQDGHTELTNYVGGRSVLFTDLQNQASVGAGDVSGVTGVFSFDEVKFGSELDDSETILAGGAGNDHLYGLSGNDTLSGGNGDDYLDGGVGDDVLKGGAGRDTLVGGAGNDTYQFTGAWGHDTIKDLDGAGAIEIDGLKLGVGNTELVKRADNVYWSKDERYVFVQTANGLLISQLASAGANTVTNSIQIERWQNGQLGITLPGAPPPVDPAAVNAGISLSGDYLVETGIARDFYRTNTFGASVLQIARGGVAYQFDENGNLLASLDGVQVSDNVLLGSARADTLDGLGGNDALDGRDGNDVLLGGSGDDLIAGGKGSDVINGGDGNDYISSAAQLNGSPQQRGPTDVWANWGLPLGAVAETSGATWGIYDSGNGQLTWSGVGDPVTTDLAGDVIDGGKGNDRIIGSWGDDQIEGGDGNDNVTGLAGDDFIEGGKGDDYLRGDGVRAGFFESVAAQFHGADYLDGGAGKDVIEGGGGADTLFGGSDDDEIFGDMAGRSDAPDAIGFEFQGVDYLDGEDGNDKLVGGGGDDTLYGGTGNDVLTGDIDPSSLANSAGSAAVWGDDYLNGEAGDDELIGGGGNDVLEGGEGIDSLYGDSQDAGLLAQFHGNDSLDGGAGNDYLEGGGKDDTLIGGAGNDTLVGDSDEQTLAGQYHGTDTLDGGDGNDSLYGGGGKDNLKGGAGADVLVGDAALAQLSAAFHDDDYLDGGSGDDDIIGMGGNDTLIGGEGNDFLTGDDDTTFEGDGVLSGNDTLYAGAGNDTLIGGKGNDVLFGDDGNDLLSGGDGDDTLVGGDGDDQLTGGKGRNYLVGGAGNDGYYFKRGDGIAFISDSEGFDTLYLEPGLSITDIAYSFGSLKLTTGTAGDEIHIEGFDPQNPLTSSVIEQIVERSSGRIFSLAQLLLDHGFDVIGTPLNDSLTGSSITDRINGLAGDDVIRGGAGADTLIGGEGNDTLMVSDLGDTLDGGGGDDTYVIGFKEGDGLAGTIIRDSGGNDRIVSGWRVDGVTANADNLNVNFGNFALGVQGIEGSGQDVSAIETFEFQNILGTTTVLSREKLFFGKEGFTGTVGDDVLTGTAANEVLSGLSGNDILMGGGGDDLLRSGNGVDRLDGGAGDDRYDLAGTTGNKTIADASGIDTLVLGWEDVDLTIDIVNNAFVHRTTGQKVVFEGYRFGDPIANAPIETVALANGLVLSFEQALNRPITIVDTVGPHVIQGSNLSERIYAFDGNDTVNARAGEDIVYAGLGNDLVNAGSGDDIVYGQEGNDTLNGDDGADVLWGEQGDDVIDGGAGNDSLYGDVGDDLLMGGAGDDYLTGDEGDDQLSGGAGADILIGGLGIDLLDGGIGADVMKGAAGQDRYVVDNVADVVEERVLIWNQSVVGNATTNFIDRVETDTILSSVSYTTPTSVENIELTGTDTINATDNWLSNRLVGNSADNILIGSGLNTRGDRYGDYYGLIFQTGAGGFGSPQTADEERAYDLGNRWMFLNRLVPNARFGSIVRENGLAPLTGIQALLGDTLEGGDGNDTLYGDIDNDTLTGGAGNDTLVGGGGSDTMRGGLGNDTYVVSDSRYMSFDQFSFLPTASNYNLFEAFGQGIDMVMAAKTWVLGDNFENLTLLDSTRSYDPYAGLYTRSSYYDIGAIDGTGNNLDNVITGNSSANQLFGLAGNDAIDAGAGDDYIDGGAGADRMAGQAGDDTYVVDSLADVIIENANEGRDTVVTVFDTQLQANLENLTLKLGSAAVSGTGNELNNLIVGNEQNNQLDGGIGGFDKIYAGAGDDLLRVAAAGELYGEAGNDNLIGSDQADLLNGGAGADRMVGGAGSDTYWVDQLGDTIVELAGGGDFDTVNSSISYTLSAELENLTLNGFQNQNISGTGNELNNVIRGDAGSNALSGLAGNDLMYGGTGNDTLLGGVGNDRLEGEYGNDTLDGGDGNDYLDGGFGTNQLVGGAGDDQLHSEQGSDQLFGGVGDDTYYVDSVTDAITELTGQGNDSIVFGLDTRYDKTPVNYTLNGAIENLTFKMTYGAATDLNLTANDERNHIVLSNTNDVVFAMGGDDSVDAGVGSDFIYGGAGNDQLFGGADAAIRRSGSGYRLESNNDQIFGEQGEDKIDGGSGNDQLYGGEGNDVIYGGNDRDSIVYATEPNYYDSSFGYGGTASTPGILPNDDYLDGGAGDDYLDGGTGNDRLFGGAGSDVLIGGADYVGSYPILGGNTNYIFTSPIVDVNNQPIALAGYQTIQLNNNDYLDGGEGIDRMEGGSGDDIYVVDGIATANANGGSGLVNLCDVANRFGVDRQSAFTFTTDTVIESNNNGFDTVRTSASVDFSNQSIELVELLAGGSVLDLDAKTGADSQRIIGNDGNNRLDGGAGGDTLEGGLGNDIYYADALDTLTEASNAGLDTVHTAVEGYALVSNFENLVLEGNAIVGRGNADNNSVIGNNANNILYGLDGNDVLAGWRGDDRLEGGAGDDTYAFSRGDGVDTIIDLQGQGRIHFGGDITKADLKFELVGSDMVIRLMQNGLETSDRLILQNWTGAAQRVSSLTFCQGLPVVLDESLVVVNHAPVALDDAVALAQDQSTVTGSLLLNDSDPDVGSVLRVLGAGQLLGQYGTLTIAADGQFSYALNSAIDKVRALGVGESLTESFVYTISDSDAKLPLQASARLQVQINGLNDRPVVADDSATVTEDLLLVRTGNVLTNDKDIDRLDVLTVANAGTLQGSFGKLILSQDGGYSYALNNASVGVQQLRAGQTVTEFFDVKINDGHLGAQEWMTSRLTISVVGTNDGPIVANPVADQTARAKRAFLYTVPSNAFTDIDMGDVLGYQLTLNDGSAIPSWLSFNAATRTLSGTPPDTASGQSLILKITAIDTLGASATDVFNLTIGSCVGLNLVGTVGKDRLVGTDCDDTIDGRAGGDTMIGGDGDDTYYVDSANCSTNDIVTELDGQGYDKVISSVTYSLPTAVEALTLSGTAHNNGTGNSLDNWMVGNVGNNLLDGGAGNDLLSGGAGDDRLVGGLGADVLEGQAGNDILEGGAGTDALFGGAGNDVLDSGTGAGLLVGGVGADTLYVGDKGVVVTFNKADGADTINWNGIHAFTISLGGGIKYEDIKLRRSGADLYFDLNTARTDSIRIANYYNNCSVVRPAITLQMLNEPAGQYVVGSTNPYRDQKIEQFNAGKLVADFNSAYQTTSALRNGTSWSVMNSLLAAHLGGSDDSVLGGDLAYQYGVGATLGGLDMGFANAQLQEASFGVSSQVLHAPVRATSNAPRFGG
jgi:trimeric autotransporter adhesin